MMQNRYLIYPTQNGYRITQESEIKSMTYTNGNCHVILSNGSGFGMPKEDIIFSDDLRSAITYVDSKSKVEEKLNEETIQQAIEVIEIERAINKIRIDVISENIKFIKEQSVEVRYIYKVLDAMVRKTANDFYNDFKKELENLQKEH
jgi:hypothetical protein